LPGGARVWSTIDNLWKYCQEKDFHVYRPPNSQDSTFFNFSPNAISKRVINALLRRSPSDLHDPISNTKRPAPEALGRLLSAASKLYKMTGDAKYRSAGYKIAENLAAMRCTRYSDYCWGGDFGKRMKSISLPGSAPNAASTSIVGNAYLDASESYNDTDLLNVAESAADFMASELRRSPSIESACFSFSPGDSNFIHSANMAAAAFLARIFTRIEKHEYADLSYNAVDFTLGYQNPDGSWHYGISDNGKHIDSYHNGCIIIALGDYIKFSRRRELGPGFRRAAEYYIMKLLTDDGTPKFNSRETYPIDIVNCAMAIMTLVNLTEHYARFRGLLKRTVQWVLDNMGNDNGYFHYRRNRVFTGGIPHAHGGQACMLNALAACYDYMQRNGIARPSEQFNDGYRIIFEEDGFSFVKAES
jgi:hypothetical protein